MCLSRLRVPCLSFGALAVQAIAHALCILELAFSDSVIVCYPKVADAGSEF